MYQKKEGVMFSWFKKKQSTEPLLIVQLSSIVKKGFYEENDPFSAIHEDINRMEEQILGSKFGENKIPIETRISFLYVQHFSYSSMYIQGLISDEDYAAADNKIMYLISTYWDLIGKRGLSASEVDSLAKSVMADVATFIYSYDNRLTREAVLNIQVMAEKQIAIFTAMYKIFLDDGNSNHLAMHKSGLIITPFFCIDFLNNGGWDRVNDDFDRTVKKVDKFKQRRG